MSNEFQQQASETAPAFELKETPKVAIKVYGEIHFVRRPDLDMMTAVQEVFESDRPKTKDMVKASKAFLVKAGLPDGLVNRLEFDHLSQLVEFLSKPKKN